MPSSSLVLRDAVRVCTDHDLHTISVLGTHDAGNPRGEEMERRFTYEEFAREEEDFEWRQIPPDLLASAQIAFTGLSTTIRATVDQFSGTGWDHPSAYIPFYL